MALPDFLIIGAQKSGTSWLARNINQHPQIYIPSHEIHFFNLEKNYNQGSDWYESQFPSNTPHMLIGDKTPNYLWVTDIKMQSDFGNHLPNIHHNIFETIPQVKLIITLRNPVHRAISAINHYKKNGQIPPFVNAKDLILGNKKKYSQQFGIIDMGLYHQHIKKYYQKFDDSQLLILIFEIDIVQNPEEGLRKVCEFLEIDSSFKFNSTKNKVHHFEERPYILSLLNHYMPNVYPHLQKLKPSFLRNSISKVKKNLKQTKAEYSEDVSNFLIDFYKEENEKLFHLLKHDIPSWEL